MREKRIPTMALSRIASSGGHAPGVANRIQSGRPEMSGAMAKIADYVLEHPQAPLKLSIGELAKQAGASAATVTRFCRLIGYSGYVPFRVSIATDLGRSTAQDSWKTDIGRAFGPDDPAADVLSTLINAHTRTLQETASAIDITVVSEISQRIATSTHVDIYGVGGSAMLAEELQARLYRIGINAHAWSEVHAGLTSAAIQDSSTVAIGISNTGRTEETIQMLSQAKSSGAYTIALTNSADSPLARVAEEHIVTASPEHYLQPDDLSAKHSQLFVLDLLYLLIAQFNFSQTATKLAASAIAVSPHRRAVRASRGDGAASRTAALAKGTDQ